MPASRWMADGYSYRVAICIPTASTTADYVQFDPAAWWDAFWDTVLSTGYDVIAYTVAGTVLPIERVTWTYASKVADFQITYADLFGATDWSEIIWVYWGKTGASDASTAVANTGLVTSAVRVFRSSTFPPRLVLCVPDAPGASTPLTKISKTTWETIMVWWDVTPLLGLQDGTFNDRQSPAFELGGIDWDSTAGTGVYLSGTRDGTLTTQARTVVLEAEDGHLYVGIEVTGGTVNVDYTMSLRMTLLQWDPTIVPGSQFYEARAILQVRNPSE